MIESIPVPVPPRGRPLRTRASGRDVVDDWAWLRDRADPEVAVYLAAENAYTDAMLEHTSALQSTLRTELAGRVEGIGASLDVPSRRGRYRFEVSSGADRGDDGYPIVTRVDDSNDDRRVVLDVNDLGAVYPYVSVARCLPSHDGELLAYSVDRNGDERNDLTVVDLRTGSTILTSPSVGSFVWTGDDASLYFTNVSEAPWRNADLHRFDTANRTTEFVRHESDRTMSLSLRHSTSGEIVFLAVSSVATGGGWIESSWLPTDGSTTAWQALIPRTLGVLHVADHGAGSDVVLRVDDAGPLGRVVSAPLEDPVPANWREVLAHGGGPVIETVVALAGAVAVTERVDGLPRVRIVDTARSRSFEIDEPGCVWSIDASANRSADGQVVCSVTSLVRPPTTATIDVASGTLALAEPTSIAGYDPSRYELIRTFATTDDGVDIPIELIRRRGLAGPSAVLLYGYGCYGYSEEPKFNASRLSLVDRGVAFAIAHPRGGGEYGRPWHDAGRRLNKTRTWADFVAAGRHLIDTALCAPDRLVIAGGSAGGTLVMAAANLAPELFRAVVAWVPFADPFYVQLDESMPFTVFERHEWGDPYASAEEFDYLLSHCPFSNLRDQHYPAMYVTTAPHDGQVPYWQPTKYVARMRSLETQRGPILFRVAASGGHQGASRTSTIVADHAEYMAFVLDQLGITE